MSGFRPQLEPETTPRALPEDRRRRCERRAALGDVVLRAASRPRRPPENLAKSVMPIDRRTKLGRALADFRGGLTRHCGNQPSETQRALIELACQLKARLILMDAKFAERGDVNGHDSRVYLSWSNSLARTLRQLGTKGVAQRQPTPMELLNTPAHTLPAVAGRQRQPTAADAAQRVPDGPVAAE